MSTGMIEQRLEELERRLAAVETLLPFSTNCEGSTPRARTKIGDETEIFPQLQRADVWAAEAMRAALATQSLKSNSGTKAAISAADSPLTQSDFETPLKTEPPTAQGSQDSWQELFGWHRDDTLFRDAARSGAEWRGKMNKIEE